MIRSNIKEVKEATVAKFMNDLNHDIAHIIELHHYVELEEIVHMAMKMKKQLK